MPFQYPGSVILELRQRWRDFYRSGTPDSPSLPTDAVLLELLEVAYHASFRTEELRRIGVRLAFIPQESALKGAKETLPFQERHVVSFETSLEFSVSELARLAPATDVTQMLIAVDQMHLNAETPELRIWGLLDAGSSWWRFIRGEDSSGLPPPDCLTIVTTQPGQLRVSREGTTLLVLRDGKIYLPTETALYIGEFARFFRPAQRALYRNVVHELGKKRWDDDDQDDDFPARFYIKFVERLITAVSEKLHGGTLLFVPDRLSASDSRLQDRIRIKYPCSDTRVWPLLKSYLVNHRRYYDLHFPMWDAKRTVRSEDYRNVSILDGYLESIQDAINDSIRFIASLTGVDGAVVLTDHLRLLGFGGEVTALSSTLTSVVIASDEKRAQHSRVAIDSFGTRHRSAFRFCSSYEDGAALVISQDGAVRAVRRVGADLLIWPDVRSTSLHL